MSTRTPTKSLILRTWENRIDAGRMSKSQCQQFCRVATLQAEGYAPRGHKTNLTADEAVELVDRLKARGGVLLTAEHEAQGLAWIKAYGTKRVGIPVDVIEAFDHFSFRGDAYLYGNHYWMAATPVWRIHTTDGGTVDYFCNAWQTGHEVAMYRFGDGHWRYA